jgi:hypothetical protein
MLKITRHLPTREVALEADRLAYGVVAVGGYQERLRDLDESICSIDVRRRLRSTSETCCRGCR